MISIRKSDNKDVLNLEDVLIKLIDSNNLELVLYETDDFFYIRFD